MDYASGPIPLLSHINPAAFAELMPSRPSITSELLGWSDTTVQRYSLVRCAFGIPPANELRLGLHMGGPMQVRAHLGSDHDVTRWLEPGQINLIPAGQGADWDFRGRPELLLVHISSNLFKAVASDVYNTELDQIFISAQMASADETANLLARQLLVETGARFPGTQLYADSITRALCLHLLRRYSSLGASQPQPQATIPSGRTGRIIDFIRANFAEDLSLDQLASVSGVSASQFGRAFRAETGQTPHRYLIKVRVEVACDMLEHTTLSVIEVALRCGFGQPGHFATTFRHSVGMTPREYRAARCT